ncbi:UNVERIFIED_CONTAM: Nuclear receptor 2C2-associated protein [Siphonaria sp. JEL0065]|nr:Nuclear receptor 2C2-associated protein [Siphonaria sp. JEL0065]
MSLLSDSSLFKTKASSTLNKDTKSFGKQYLTDGSLETCWNSDQGANQWIIIEFTKQITATQLSLMFQGGFTSTEVQVLAAVDSTPSASSADWVPLMAIYPEDSNKEQLFALSSEGPVAVRSVKLLFTLPSDTFGRIVIYKLDILGDV